MRPKVIILILVAAFGLLGIIALLKGVTGKNAGADDGQPTIAKTATGADSADTNNQPAPAGGSNNSVAVSDELRAAIIDKQVDEIRDLQGQVDGTNNLMIITAIIGKMSNPEVQVQKAALDALRQLDDTNAVPGLQQVAAGINDPREKVAILDTIDYIKLPSATDNVPPELQTNREFGIASTSTNVQFNPAFLKGNNNIRKKGNGQQTVPPGVPANQPQ
jgi:hypothetical protein